MNKLYALKLFWFAMDYLVKLPVILLNIDTLLGVPSLACRQGYFSTILQEITSKKVHDS